MDRAFAERVVAVTGQCIDQLLQLLAEAKVSMPPDSFSAFKRSIARIINTIDLHVVEKAVSAYPDLKPWGDDAEQSQNGGDAPT
jgi:DNA-binding ferritin-like protein